jgi:hypothetical protein
MLQPRLDQERPNWVGALGDRRGFRVRGFSWFKEKVPAGVAAMTPLLRGLGDTVAARPNWVALPFVWTEPFSIRQVYDAANRKPLLFPKAAMTILLCELAAAERGIDPREVYRNMRIEPAVYRIADFTAGTLVQAESVRDDILNILTRECGQESSEVFRDMADRKVVSYRLATRAHAILKRELPRLRIGDVVVGSDRKYRITSEAETVEGVSVPRDDTDWGGQSNAA